MNWDRSLESLSGEISTSLTSTRWPKNGPNGPLFTPAPALTAETHFQFKATEQDLWWPWRRRSTSCAPRPKWNARQENISCQVDWWTGPIKLHCVASGLLWYFVKLYWNVPLSFGLIQQLLRSTISNQNFRKITKQNISTEWTPDSVFLSHEMVDECKTVLTIYTLRRPLMAEVVSTRIWGVPPACLGSR